jgi:transposase
MTSKNKKRQRRPRRRFTEEFKADVVRLCQSDNESIAEVSQRLDLTESAVRGWVAKAEAAGTGGTIASAVTSSEREELQRLRREVKQLWMERYIKKKAATFFAKESS